MTTETTIALGALVLISAIATGAAAFFVWRRRRG